MDHLAVGALAVLLSFVLHSGCRTPGAGPIAVSVERLDDRWLLRRGAAEYVIRGAGGQSHLDQLAAAGGNSIRTWDGEGIDQVLDRAHALGLTVTVGIWLEHERHGFDYDNPASKASQLDKVERIVRAYRDHPAVLMWGVGNEVELGGDLDTALRAIEDAAALIKKLDPSHPRMAVIAEIGDDKAVRVRDECPSIDLLGINSYGGGPTVPERLTAQGYDGPYVMTEFGPRGHWEGPKTSWGAPIEPTSIQKAEMYERTYLNAVQSELGKRCLGSYVFLWGQKQETTATWFGMFLESGEATPTVDVMRRMWSGRDDLNSAPLVGAVTAPEIVVPGQRLAASVDVSDPDSDDIVVEWSIFAESADRRQGGDAERAPPRIPIRLLTDPGYAVEIEAPRSPGAYRLFVHAFDGEGGAATSNIPFLVRENTNGSDHD